MSAILTPTTLWNEFDDSLDLNVSVVKNEKEEGVTFESIMFSGRETGEGRVEIFGVYAYGEQPSKGSVLIFPDSFNGIDKDVLKLFVNGGYSAFMVDYRGEWDEAEYFTKYPECVSYANSIKCGRYKDFVDETADKTSWYEWVGVGIYARKYLVNRTASEDIAVVGLRDGGEIAWKLAVARKFSCIVPVCSAGWLAYLGISKFMSDEHKLDSERYRFIAGIDSQAYAPYVLCPVLLLCSTNDSRFDYDRAYDTFSRINKEFISQSVISYSVLSDSTIDSKSIANMFLFLDKYLKHNKIFIPQPVEISVTADEEQNLIATAKFDNSGNVEDFGMFKAEDCIDTAMREWTQCVKTEKINDFEHKVYLDLFEETSTLFLLCYAKYSNGFTIWSKMAVKKTSGRFKNSCGRCRVIYTSKNGTDGFFVADPATVSVGGVFLAADEIVPQIVTKAKGIKGLYSANGLITYRFNSPRYKPTAENVLKIDVFCDETSEINLLIEDSDDREIYRYSQSILGGVWQSIILESKLFKTPNGAPLTSFAHNVRFCISCENKFAINNVMWL